MNCNINFDLYNARSLTKAATMKLFQGNWIDYLLFL